LNGTHLLLLQLLELLMLPNTDRPGAINPPVINTVINAADCYGG
jgi:hypothetical protein